ncbi:MAG: type II toxin-antitoxin system RelE/ParE family toxin [Alphaproteobacteria bacterium]|nr:type II toxin-antitoxin system RelE/ParE family toxin [Alphaproteobacteria bacterium]
MSERPLLTLRITPAAENDLAEIWSYIAEDAPDVATTFIEQIADRFEPLLAFPGMGVARDQLAPGLRAIPYKAYVIYYVADEKTVTIVRVVHGARDVRAIF